MNPRVHTSRSGPYRRLRTLITVSDSVKSALAKAHPDSKSIVRSLEAYPENVIDVVIYHRIYFHMKPSVALKSYRQLQQEFVDWNEVRISPIREIQEHLSKGADSLELSVYIKDFLEFVHSDQHRVDLEHLVDDNLSDVRRYLKQARAIEPSTIDLVLMLRKSPPRPSASASPRDDGGGSGPRQGGRQRGTARRKSLFEITTPDGALAFHHLALDVLREYGPDDLPEYEPSPRVSERTDGPSDAEEEGAEEVVRDVAGRSNGRQEAARQENVHEEDDRKETERQKGDRNETEREEDRRRQKDCRR